MDEKPKKVELSLYFRMGAKLDLLAIFRREAKRQGWEEADIDAVVTEAGSGDFDHLIKTLMAHVVDPSEVIAK